MFEYKEIPTPGLKEEHDLIPIKRIGIRRTDRMLFLEQDPSGIIIHC